MKPPQIGDVVKTGGSAPRYCKVMAIDLDRPHGPTLMGDWYCVDGTVLPNDWCYQNMVLPASQDELDIVVKAHATRHELEKSDDGMAINMEPLIKLATQLKPIIDRFEAGDRSPEIKAEFNRTSALIVAFVDKAQKDLDRMELLVKMKREQLKANKKAFNDSLAKINAELNKSAT